MSGDQRDNVYIFPTPERTSNIVDATPRSGCRDQERVAEGDAGFDASDLRAMAECLQYLYRESNRLDAKTTSRLIGAAAMAVAEDIRERER
jgi:hypothetical protein